MCRCEVAIACPLDSSARDMYVQVLSHPLRDDAAAGQKTITLYVEYLAAIQVLLDCT